MSWQKHIIRKQVIELQIPGDINSREIQYRTSQVARERLLPLIDKALGEINAEGTVEKIDLLELDLGIIPVSQLEELLVRNTAAELENKLHLAIRKKEPATPVKRDDGKNKSGSGLDMIAYFLQTGLFPWWAKENTAHAFEQVLNEALLHEPSRLKDLLHALLQHEAGLTRLIYSCSDIMLYSIIQSYAYHAVSGIRKLQAGFTLAVKNKPGARQLRLIWWQTVITVVIYEQESSGAGFVERTAGLLASRREISVEFSAVHEKSGEAALADPALPITVQRLEKSIETIRAQLATLLPGALLSAESTQGISTHLQAMQNILHEISKGNTLPVTYKQQSLEKLSSYAKQAALFLMNTAGENAAARTSVLQGQLSEVLSMIEDLVDQELPSRHKMKEKSGPEATANTLKHTDVLTPGGSLVPDVAKQLIMKIEDLMNQVPAAKEQTTESRPEYEEVANSLKNVEEKVNRIVGTDSSRFADIQIIENCVEQVEIIKRVYAKTNAKQRTYNTTGHAVTGKLEEQLHEIKTLLAEPAGTNGEQRRAAGGDSLGNMLASIKAVLVKLSQFSPESMQQASAATVSLSHHKKKPVSPARKLYDPFSETEKVYIGNAGLILLWPFLHRFFRNLGLAGEKAFADESAAEKACLLLHHLAGTPPEELIEAQLPLNKILCGIDWQQPVNTQRIIEPDEAEAAENFLQAVIQNGPLWKTLSIPGFRQAYLNREGLISTRDGNWLLQVKRETYDVIVDRLPWTIQIVKLPWMERLIFTEW